MTFYPVPANEPERLKALESYNVLNESAKEGFVRLIRLALATCDVPIAYISLLDADRSRFLAKSGINTDEIPREKTLCQYTIMSKFLLFVEDTAQDERFRDKALVAGKPGIRFYASQPLVDQNGHVLGCFSIADTVPRQINEKQKEILKTLTEEAVAQIVFLRDQHALLKERDVFLGNMSHEIRTPLTAIIGFTNLMQKTEMDKEQREFTSIIRRASYHLLGVIDNIDVKNDVEKEEIHVSGDRMYDFTYLNELSKDEGFVGEMIELFIRQSSKEIDDLKLAVRTHDFEGIETISQRINSSYQFFMIRDEHLLSRIEQAGRNKHGERLEEMVARLEEIHHMVTDQLRERLLAGQK